ncbi:hypothetical protein F5887DRAFT_1141193 [Amanita rubescens]|nr:hypothetical protein F5887DRAFT_1141193 [Amanita rubescens]
MRLWALPFAQRCVRLHGVPALPRAPALINDSSPTCPAGLETPTLPSPPCCHSSPSSTLPTPSRTPPSGNSLCGTSGAKVTIQQPPASSTIPSVSPPSPLSASSTSTGPTIPPCTLTI